MTALSGIFERPAPTDVAWDDLIELLRGLGVEILAQGASRVALVYGDNVMIVHRQASNPLTVRATVRDVAAFLRAVGLGP